MGVKQKKMMMRNLEDTHRPTHSIFSLCLNITLHLHARCYQDMIILLISLNIMIETLCTGGHGDCSTSLAQNNKDDPHMKNKLTVVLRKEENSNCKFNP